MYNFKVCFLHLLLKTVTCSGKNALQSGSIWEINWGKPSWNQIWQGVLTEWSLGLWMCVRVCSMQTDISGTSWEILGFLMIQNILCFTSGIVNALCIIDMGLLVVNRQCDTYCPMKIYVNEGTPYKTWRLGSFLTTYVRLGSCKM